MLKINHEINKKSKEAQKYAKTINMTKNEYQKLIQENTNLENAIFKMTKNEKDNKKNLKAYRLTMKIAEEN